jgi:bacillithiol biosynthesis cysteine-adding enzyme BshC
MIPTLEPTPLVTDGTDPLAQLQSRDAAIAPDLIEAFVATGETAERNLERLANGALCVTTGQQPGLFTGPLLTVYKALSAVALAEQCSQLLGQPVVPVFWVAGDDHDFAEVNHTHLLDTDNEVQRVTLRTREPDAPALSMFRETLGPDVDAAIDAVTALTPDTEFKSHELEWLRRHYRADHDVAGAFADALADRLGRLGLVVFRPTHPRAKAAAAPFIVRALQHAAAIDRDVRAHVTELARAGHSVPVDVAEGNTMVMVEGATGRDRLVIDGDRFVSRRASEAWTLDELRGVAEQHPERLSANVLLRPVVEAAILPTIAYVAGPAERAYIRQSEPIYRLLDVDRQSIAVRWSGRVMEKRVTKVLEKYGIDAEELLAPEGQLEGRLAGRGMPAEAEEALRGLRDAVQTHYPTLVNAAVSVDPTLKKPVQSHRGAALAALADVEKRIVSHLKKNDEILMRQIATARNALFPLRKPQERVFNLLQYTVRYGDAFLDEVRDACRTWAQASAVGARQS